MSDPVTWLDVIVLVAAYLVASGLYRFVMGLLAARDRFREITETAAEVAPDCKDPACLFRRLHHAHIEIRQQTGDEAAPERPDDVPGSTSRAGCNPAASPPLHRLDRDHVVRRRD